MSSRVLVTGGDGFLGSHIVNELLDANYRVRVFCERGRNVEALKTRSVEIAPGDIRVSAEVGSAVAGCDFVIHAAACTDVWPPRSARLEKINVEGTRNIIEAALENRVVRLVYVGTANSFGAGSESAPGTEENPANANAYGLGYIETKREAQRLVREAIEMRGLRAIIAAPTFMIGPNDAKPGSGQLVIAIAERRIPGFTGGGRNYVHVRDVAKAIVSALSGGREGESYILGNANLPYRDFFRLVGEVWGVKPPSMLMPRFLVAVTGWLGSIFGYLSGIAPKVSIQVSRISLDSHYYSAAKAVRELGLPQTPIETAIREALEWFNMNGYLSSRITRRPSSSKYEPSGGT